MTTREKSAWISLLITGLIYVPYFTNAYDMLRAETIDPGDMLGLFIGAVVLQTLLHIVFEIALAIIARKEPTDERDKAIENRATGNAYWFLSISTSITLLVGLFALVLAVTPLEARFHVLAFATQLLLLCLVAAEVVRYVTLIYSYRHGA
ncbi:MAG: hypothetical protein ACREOU_06460 [Candidatus Eiseniibacteriota bacterium]